MGFVVRCNLLLDHLSEKCLRDKDAATVRSQQRGDGCFRVTSVPTLCASEPTSFSKPGSKRCSVSCHPAVTLQLEQQGKDCSQAVSGPPPAAGSGNEGRWQRQQRASLARLSLRNSCAAYFDMELELLALVPAAIGRLLASETFLVPAQHTWAST